MASCSRPSRSRQRNIINDLDVAETDPTGQFVRYNKLIGFGSTKRVFMGLDTANATEVAWSVSVITEKTTKSEGSLKKIYEEGNLLKSLEHENILKCCQAWEDRRGNVVIVHMITELFTCGTLFEYIKKHNLGGNHMAIKNFARQILKALDYLHRHDPTIIHHDVKGNNIYVDGKTGRVKLADFDQAMSPFVGDVQTFACTPEFMAPELMIGKYDQKIDIYSFGMCVVEIVSQELPYTEFEHNKISEKVAEGVRPLALNKVTDPEVMRFIERCITRDASARPTAMELLNDPFLAWSDAATVDSPMELVMEGCNEKGDTLKLKGTKKVNSLAMTLRIIPKEKQFAFEVLEADSFHLIKKKLEELALPSAEDVRHVTELTVQLTAELKSRPPLSRSQQNQDMELEQHEDSEDEEKTQPRCFGKLLFKGFNSRRKS